MLDPEKLLYVPGAKLISIPNVITRSVNLGDIYWDTHSIYLYEGTKWMEFSKLTEGFAAYGFIEQLPSSAVPLSPGRRYATLRGGKLTFTELAAKNATPGYR